MHYKNKKASNDSLQHMKEAKKKQKAQADKKSKDEDFQMGEHKLPKIYSMFHRYQ